MQGLEFIFIPFGTPPFDEAVALRNEILRIPLGLEFYPKDIAGEYKEYHIGAYKDLYLCACLSFKPLSDDWIKMRQVAVRQAYQRQGIGRRLVQYAEHWAFGHGYTQIRLHARDLAVPFYQKLNYQCIGEPFEEVGIQHYVMYKNAIAH